mgnify:FL=1
MERLTPKRCLRSDYTAFGFNCQLRSCHILVGFLLISPVKPTITSKTKKGHLSFLPIQRVGKAPVPFLLCQKEDDLVDLLLQFIKLGAGKAPCQRDSKGIEGRAVQHTQLRTLRKYFMAWEIRSCVIARENIYRQNKKVSSTWKMEDTNLSTSLFEFSYYFIMVISGNQ